MNNCPKCQSANLQNARYCMNCGYDNAPTLPERVTCPTCKQSYPADTQFCMVDGTRLTKPFKEAFQPAHETLPPVYEPLPDDRILDGGSVYQPAVYPKASLGNRFLAMLLDGLVALGLALPSIFCLVIGIAQISGEYQSKSQTGILLTGLGFLMLILPFAYMFIKDGLGQGQSYGKRAMNLIVIDLKTYQPCTKGTSALRHIVSILVACIPLVGSFIEPIMVLVNNDGRKLSDKAANTQVVDTQDYYR